MLDFDIKKYVYQYLFPARRKPKFLQFINALVHPIEHLWLNFRDWRTKQVYDINIGGQTFTLQEHLNSLFDSEQKRIKIAHYADTGVFVPLESEGYEALEIGLESEGQGLFVALEGEIQENVGASFLVNIPIEINKELVLVELYKYKLAGKTFLIIEN